MIGRKQGCFYSLTAAGFLYAIIIVDLYRKLIGTNVETIRNSIYILLFILIGIDMIKTKRIKNMLFLGFVVSLLFMISYLINDNYNQVYKTSMFLFFSRMWPAYYVGRYTENWDDLCKMVFKLSPIALAYALSLFVIPEIAGGIAYATIASNIGYVAFILLLYTVRMKKAIGIAISVICLIPVFFYGTRVFFIGALVSLLFLYIYMAGNTSKTKRIVLISLIIISFIVAGEAIISYLATLFPNSRTLSFMVSGNMMDDSNRREIYAKLLTSLKEKPFKIYGLIGDRIFLANSYDTTSTILSYFSHNCILEICMNFGLIPGIILSIYYIVKLCIATKNSFANQNIENGVFLAILGVCAFEMMISASYISSYMVWLLFGLANYINNKKIKSMVYEYSQNNSYNNYI